MTSINLVKQIKNRKSGKGGTKAGAPGGGPTGLAGLIAKFTAGSGQLDQKEKTLLMLFLFGIASIFGARGYLSLIYFPAQEAGIRDQITQIETNMANVKAKLAAFDGIKNDIESYEKKMAEVREKLNLIDSIQKGRNSIVRMVDFIVGEMPTAIWLSSLKIDSASDKNPLMPRNFPTPTPQPSATPQATPGAPNVEQKFGSVAIKGSATSLQLVSEFMKRLEGAVFFPKWSLIETREEANASAVSTFTGAGATSLSTRSSGPNLPAESKAFEVTAKVVAL